MSRSRTPQPSRAVDGAHLEALASVLLAGIVLEPGDPPQLVRLRADADDLDPDELELGVLPLDDVAHPLEGLVGLEAPADWAAVGLVATGRATQLDAPGANRPFAVSSVHLVARSGSWASAWRALQPGSGTDGSASGPGASGAAGTGGRLDDALRRVLGLPTAPPPRSTHRLWATEWLDALVEAAAAGGSRRARLPVEAVLGLHPAVAAFDLDPASMTVAELVAEGDKLAAWRDWPRLRQACASGAWSHPLIDAGTAAWLDDGSFARLALGGWPELHDLRDAIGVLLAPPAAAAVDDALAAWGLP
jgi:hypothetical protein